MNNPTRRNKNIGTKKQGYKKQSRFDIPCYYIRENKIFYEKLSNYKKIERMIKGWEFTFIIERTKRDFFHACTIEDLERILHFIPSAHFQDLKTIILRQPKRTEAIFSPVWGRLVFQYELEGAVFPAIILEAFKKGDRIRCSRKIGVDAYQELERIRNDGFEFTETKRSYETSLNFENVRNVQLYRTLLHEVGHYVHYCRNPDLFDRLPSNEKETFAHKFADTLKLELEQKNLIPFPRQLFKASFVQNNLDPNDFLEDINELL